METSASQELTCKNRYSRETHKVIKWSKVITLGKELHGVFLPQGRAKSQNRTTQG